MRRRTEMLWLSAVVAPAAVLRFYHLGANSLWADEGSSVAIAGLPWHSMGAILWGRELNMVLYYVLLRGWMHLSSGETFIRALSALASLGTVVAVYWLGRRLSGGRAWAGLLAAAFLAVNGWNIHYAQEARSYALLLFVSCLAAISLVYAVEDGGARYWAGFVAAVIAGFYLQFFMLFVLGALVGSLLFLPWRNLPGKPLAWSLAACFAGFLPILIFILEHDEDRMGWLPPLSRALLQDYLTLLAGFSRAAGILLLALVLASAWQLWRLAGVRGRSLELWREALPLCWLVLPVLVVGLYSLHHRLFLARYMQICLPAAALVVGITGITGTTGIRGMTRALLPRAVSGTAGGALILLMAWQLPGYYRQAPHEDWRSATRYVVSKAQPGDVAVIYIPTGRGSFEYYRRRMGGPLDRPTVVYPGSKQMDENGLNGIPFVFAAGTLKPEYKTVWVILNNVDFSPSAQNAAQEGLKMMSNRFRAHTKKDFYQLRVYRYER